MNSAVMDAVKLDGVRRAALVLLGLGEESAAAVLKHMSARDVRRLHEAMADIRRVTPRQSTETLRDFLHWMRKHHSLRLSGANDFIRRTAARAHGEDSAQKLIAGTDPTTGEEAHEDQAFQLLDGVDANVLSTLLKKEHPQTSALVLSHLSTNKAADVLRMMPDEMRTDILMRIARTESIFPETVREVASVIELELAEFALQDKTGQMEGPKTVAGIMTRLSSVDKAVGTGTLTNIEEQDETLAGEIRQAMFTFEDLERLDNRNIQILLREIDGENLVKALKSATESLRDKILSNMSARAAAIILEDLEGRGPMRVSEVTAAQNEIVAMALQLEAEGRIEFFDGGDGAMI